MILLTVPLFAYLGLCGAVYSQQAHLVFFPVRQVRLTPKDYQMDFQELHRQSQDGTRLHG